MLELFRRFDDKRLRYLIVGAWNAAFGYLSALALYQWLGQRVHIVVVAVLVNIVCITMSFLTYKLLVFRTHGHWLREYLRCYVVYSGGIVMGVTGMWVLISGLHVPFWIAQGGVIVLGVVVSYFGHTLFTFKRRSK